jgi:hypothetical protein
MGDTHRISSPLGLPFIVLTPQTPFSQEIKNLRIGEEETLQEAQARSIIVYDHHRCITRAQHYKRNRRFSDNKRFSLPSQNNQITMAAWLALKRETGDWIITDTSHLKKVVYEMDSLSSQRPSVQLFIGGPTKLQALRALNPQNNITRQSNVGFAQLHQHSVTSPYSILVIKSSLSPGP